MHDPICNLALHVRLRLKVQSKISIIFLQTKRSVKNGPFNYIKVLSAEAGNVNCTPIVRNYLTIGVQFFYDEIYKLNKRRSLTKLIRGVFQLF